MKIYIIDDEISACTILERLLEKIVPSDTEVKTFNSPEVAILALKDSCPNLIFLDIEMPKINGFQLLMEINQIKTEVIFTTAYEHYALKAIKFSALDYILKPIDRFELESSFKRYVEKVSRANYERSNVLLEHLQDNLTTGNEDNFKLVLSVKEGHYRIDRSDIICIEAKNNYSQFHFTNRKSILVSKTLKEYDDLLSGECFIRTHKSFLVNKAYIESVRPEGEIVMANNVKAQVSRRNIALLKSIIKKS